MVEKQLVVFVKILQELDPAGHLFETLDNSNLFLGNLSARSILQKKIYILQEVCGIQLGWSFGWARYSEGLAEQLTFYWDQKQYNKEEVEEVEELARRLNFKTEIAEALQRGKCLFAPPIGITEDNCIDLVSAIHYMSIYLYKAALLRDKDKEVWNVTKETLDKSPQLRPLLGFIGQAWERLWNCLETERLAV